jgi:hypothetical protein
MSRAFRFQATDASSTFNAADGTETRDFRPQPKQMHTVCAYWGRV